MQHEPLRSNLTGLWVWYIATSRTDNEADTSDLPPELFRALPGPKGSHQATYPSREAAMAALERAKEAAAKGQ